MSLDKINKFVYWHKILEKHEIDLAHPIYLDDNISTIKQKIFIHKQFIKNKVPLLKDKGSKYFHYCAEGVRIIKSYKPLMKRLGVMFGTINNQPKELN